ncbi:MAG: hypothetical protein ACTSX1_05145 [Candidatus Heimdallarchaeaceae archaeon]
MNVSHKVCSQCKKIYKIHDTNSWALAILGVVLVVISFSLFGIQINGPTNPAFTLIGLLLSIGWAIILFHLIMRERNCSVCHGKNTLIKLDTPQAIEIIKENNLSVPE